MQISMGMLAFVGVYDPCLYLGDELDHEAAHEAHAAYKALAALAGGVGNLNATDPGAAVGDWDGVPPGLMRSNVVCALVRAAGPVVVVAVRWVGGWWLVVGVAASRASGPGRIAGFASRPRRAHALRVSRSRAVPL